MGDTRIPLHYLEIRTQMTEYFCHPPQLNSSWIPTSWTRSSGRAICGTGNTTSQPYVHQGLYRKLRNGCLSQYQSWRHLKYTVRKSKFGWNLASAHLFRCWDRPKERKSHCQTYILLHLEIHLSYYRTTFVVIANPQVEIDNDLNHCIALGNDWYDYLMVLITFPFADK